MDMRAYYEKLRRVEAEIANRDVVVVSLETPDGGKPGVKIEAPREIAAKMIVESRARLATAKETAAYQAETVEAKRVADHAAEASRTQLIVMSREEVDNLKGRPRARKS